ncbi:MAG: hypothetical protein ACOVQ0_00030 [Novosphingobium sp.]|uniref:hypothetical protein n=1 Tax=Novosphingobium sp. TaxID=1874826 RepID=UPI003B9D913B
MRKIAMIFLFSFGLSAILSPAIARAEAAPQKVRTPAPGTPERKRILDAIRPAAASQIRFIVHDLRVMKGKTADFAYASVEPARQEYDGGEYILKNDGGWRVIWAVTGGGSNTCADIAEYYRAMTQLLGREGIAADRLNPGHSEEQRNLSAAARDDADCNTVGDLGPALD